MADVSASKPSAVVRKAFRHPVYRLVWFAIALLVVIAVAHHAVTRALITVEGSRAIADVLLDRLFPEVEILEGVR